VNTCLVTGASGSVGPVVVDTLREAGFLVRTFSRRVPSGPVAPGIEAFAGDIANPAAVRRAVAGADAIVHLAALLHLTDPASAMTAEYERVNVTGTQVLLAAARDAGVGRVVLASTIAVYGASRGGVLNEDSAAVPDTPYATTKLKAEAMARAATRPDGAPLCAVLRCAAVYGSGMKGNYYRLVTALGSHRFVPIGDGKSRRTLVYDRDLARAMLCAATHPAAAGRLYNVSDGSTHEIRDIIEAICSALRRRPPRFCVPERAARAAAGLVDILFRASGRGRRIGPLVDKYLEDIAVEAVRIQRELQFRPKYSLEAGWSETVELMRRAHRPPALPAREPA
jgi:UDP-glucose 4-epimerase